MFPIHLCNKAHTTGSFLNFNTLRTLFISPMIWNALSTPLFEILNEGDVHYVLVNCAPALNAYSSRAIFCPFKRS